MKNRNGAALPGGLTNWCDVAENVVPGDLIEFIVQDSDNKHVLYRKLVLVLCNIPWPWDGCSYPNGLMKYVILSCKDYPAIIGHISSRQWLYHPLDNEGTIIHRSDVG